MNRFDFPISRRENDLPKFDGRPAGRSTGLPPKTARNNLHSPCPPSVGEQLLFQIVCAACEVVWPSPYAPVWPWPNNQLDRTSSCPVMFGQLRNLKKRKTIAHAPNNLST